ncbi:MAG: ECF-type sigma factor [Planctomycetota bacterium]
MTDIALTSEDDDDLTRLLLRCRKDEPAAKEKLWRQVEAELRRRAFRALGGDNAPRTLHPTALVNEAWLRLCASGADAFDDRDHFLGAALTAMRRIVIDAARRRASRRSVDGVESDQLGVDEALAGDELLAVHSALDELREAAPDLVEIVELRFYAGATLDDIARRYGVTRRTVERRWTAAKAFLVSRLQ